MCACACVFGVCSDWAGQDTDRLKGSQMSVDGSWRITVKSLSDELDWDRNVCVCARTCVMLKMSNVCFHSG